MTRVLLDNEQWDFGTNCFVCEPKNPRGLGIPFYLDAEAGHVEADVTPQPFHSSAPMFAHGGFSSALIDEGMAWVIIAIAHRFGVTRELTLTFQRPVWVGQPHRVVCRIESHDGADLTAVGEVRDAKGRVCVSARGTFQALTKEQVTGAIGGVSSQAQSYANS